MPSAKKTLKQKSNTRQYLEYLIVPVLLIILYIIVILPILSQNFTDLSYNITVLTSIPSFFIVLVTYWYVLLTRDLVDANRKLVEIQSLPNFLLTPELITRSGYINKNIYLQNNGAIARELKISFTPNWSIPLQSICLLAMGCGDKILIFENYNIFDKDNYSLKITIEYIDLYSIPHRCEYTISKEYLKDLDRIHHP